MTPPSPERVPVRGLLLMGIILGAMVLLALYANVQKWRRDKIETVIVTPISTPTPTPSPINP
jgi:hypothetical protein